MSYWYRLKNETNFGSVSVFQYFCLSGLTLKHYQLYLTFFKDSLKRFFTLYSLVCFKFFLIHQNCCQPNFYSIIQSNCNRFPSFFLFFFTEKRHSNSDSDFKILSVIVKDVIIVPRRLVQLGWHLLYYDLLTVLLAVAE